MLFPAFLKLEGRPVLVVGGGTVAEVKTRSLLAAKACVTVVAPQIDFGGFDEKLELRRRPFVPEDVDTCWLAVAAATPDVNRQVARAASARSRFVIAVDDTASSSAYAGAVLRRGGVTLSISTDGRAPARAALLRQALESVLPPDLEDWLEHAEAMRPGWRAAGVPHRERRPQLLRALNTLYEEESK